MAGIPTDAGQYAHIIARWPGCGILRAGEHVCFTGRSVRRDAMAHDLLQKNWIYTVASCEVYLDKVRVRLIGHPGLRFLRSMFDVVA